MQVPKLSIYKTYRQSYYLEGGGGGRIIMTVLGQSIDQPNM
jgi:hypothetical protein